MGIADTVIWLLVVLVVFGIPLAAVSMAAVNAAAIHRDPSAKAGFRLVSVVSTPLAVVLLACWSPINWYLGVAGLRSGPWGISFPELLMVVAFLGWMAACIASLVTGMVTAAHLIWGRRTGNGVGEE